MPLMLKVYVNTPLRSRRCEKGVITHPLPAVQRQTAARRRSNEVQNFSSTAAFNHGIHEYTWQDLGPRAIPLPRSIEPRLQ